MSKDLYQILGVTKGADTAEIKRAYRELAKKLHPDRNPDNPQAEERFKEVSAAFAVLSDDKKRKLYDEFGADGLRQGFDPNAARNYQRWARPGGGGFNFGGGGLGGFGDLDDLLGGLFGGGRRTRPAQRGAHAEAEAVISLRQALDGCELSVQGGTVRIPAGAADGQRIRVRGKGAPGPAGRGDLILTLKISAPPGFVRDGDDLSLDVPVRLKQAVLGDQVEVPTPDGSLIKLKVPAGTQSGKRARVRGRGMPTKTGRGHFYARFMVRAPDASDDPAYLEALDLLDTYYE